MKKLFSTKRSLKLVAIATGVAVTVASGLTYAWFTSQAGPVAVNVTAAKVAVETDQTLIDESPLIPGVDYILAGGLGDKHNTIKNTGDVPAVVEISFDGHDSAKLSGAKAYALAAQTAHAADYDSATYLFSPQRLAQTVELKIETNDKINPSDFVQVTDANGVVIPNKYYAYVKAGDSAKIGLVVLDAKAELGGEVVDDVTKTVSDSRQYEQQAVVSAGFTVKAVQASNNAVIDTFGADVQKAMNANGQLIVDSKN